MVPDFDNQKSPIEQLSTLQKKIRDSNSDQVSGSELLEILQDIDELYLQLIDEDVNFLLDQCEFINDFLHSDHELVNYKSDFLTCLTHIIDNELELSQEKEAKYLATVIKLGLSAPKVRKIAKKLFQKGEFLRAISWYETIFELEPTGQAIWMEYINAVKKLDSHQSIVKAFEKAILNLEDAAWIRNNFANYLFQHECFNEAEAQLRTAMLDEEKEKFNSSSYYEYASTMLNKIYIKSYEHEEQKLRRLFNYDAMLSANINQEEIAAEIENILATL